LISFLFLVLCGGSPLDGKGHLGPNIAGAFRESQKSSHDSNIYRLQQHHIIVTQKLLCFTNWLIKVKAINLKLEVYIVDVLYYRSLIDDPCKSPYVLVTRPGYQVCFSKNKKSRLFEVKICVFLSPFLL